MLVKIKAWFSVHYLVRDFRRLDGAQHFALRRLRNARHHLVGGRIVQINPFGGLRLDELAVDEQLGGGRRRARVQTLRSLAHLQ